MVKRWILYLLTLVGATVFYFAYQKWMAWLTLVAVLSLPVASLVLSLPAMLTLHLKASFGGSLPMGAPLQATCQTRCWLPAPHVSFCFQVRRPITGEQWLLKSDQPLPTEHCGLLHCQLQRGRVFDYLGLFFLPLPRRKPVTLTVLPAPIPVDHFPSLDQVADVHWRPKPGGGFSENHEIRLYRPGDKLNTVHWKLTAKTGKLTVREAMEPVRSRICLEVILRGTPNRLDEKLGKLLWLSEHLLSRDLHHELRALTADGVLILPVSDGESLDYALKTLLRAPCAPPAKQLPARPAAWCYRIGGDGDEA